MEKRIMTRLGHTPAAALTVLLLLSGGCVDLRVPDPNVVYFAFGDSTTAGPSSRDYPDQLRELLGEPVETFANEGNGGETSEQGLDRLRGLLTGDIFPNAEVMLYWESGNDMTDFIKDRDPLLLFSPDEADYPYSQSLTQQLDDTQGNIESALSAAQSEGLTVYVATYFFLREDLQECGALPFDLILPGQAARANAYLARLNERIRLAATASGATLVDVADLDDDLRAAAENYFNCNHLSAAGNGIVARRFFEAIGG